MDDQMLILEYGLGPIIQDTVNVGVDVSISRDRVGDKRSEFLDFEGGRKHAPIPWQVSVSPDGSLVAVLMSTIMQLLPYDATSQTAPLARVELEPALSEDLRQRDLCWSSDSNYIVILSGFGHVYVYSSLCVLLCRLSPHEWIEGSSLSTCVKVIPVDMDKYPAHSQRSNLLLLLAVFATGQIALVEIEMGPLCETKSSDTDHHKVRVLARAHPSQLLFQQRGSGAARHHAVEHVAWSAPQHCLVLSCRSRADIKQPLLSMIGLGPSHDDRASRTLLVVDVVCEGAEGGPVWSLPLRQKSIDVDVPPSQSISAENSPGSGSMSWLFGGSSIAMDEGAIVGSIVGTSGKIVAMVHSGGFVIVVNLDAQSNEANQSYVFSLRQTLNNVRDSDTFSGLNIIQASRDTENMIISVTNQRGEIKLLLLKRTPNALILEAVPDVYCLPPVIGPAVSSSVCPGQNLFAHVAFLRVLNPSSSQIFRMNAVLPEVVLERNIINREYSQAHDIAIRCHLDPDVVYIKQWRRATDYVMGHSKKGRNAYKSGIVDTRDVVERTLERVLLASSVTEAQRTWDVAAEDALCALRHVASESKFMQELMRVRCGAFHGPEGAGRLRFWKHVISEGCSRLHKDVSPFIGQLQRRIGNHPLGAGHVKDAIEDFVRHVELTNQDSSIFHRIVADSPNVSLVEAAYSTLKFRLQFSKQILRFYALDFLMASRSVSIVPDTLGRSLLRVLPRDSCFDRSRGADIEVENFIRDTSSSESLVLLAKQLAREAYIDELSFLLRFFGNVLRSDWLAIISDVPISVSPELLFSILPVFTPSNNAITIAASRADKGTSIVRYPDKAAISSLDLITASGEVSDSFYLRLLEYFGKENADEEVNLSYMDREKLFRWYINRALFADAFGLTFVAQLWIDCAIPRLFFRDDIRHSAISTKFSQSVALREIDFMSFDSVFAGEDFSLDCQHCSHLFLFILELKMHLFHFNSLLVNGYINEFSEFRSWCFESPRRRIWQIIQNYFIRAGCKAREDGFAECDLQPLSLVIQNAIRPLTDGYSKLYQYLPPDTFGHIARPYFISHYDIFAKDCAFVEVGPTVLTDSAIVNWSELASKSFPDVGKFLMRDEGAYQWKREIATSLGALGEEKQIDGGGITDFNWERAVVQDLIEVLGSITDSDDKFKALLIISEVVDTSAPTVSQPCRCLQDNLALISLVTKSCLAYDETSNSDALNVLWSMVEKTPTSSASIRFKTDQSNKAAERDFKHLLALLDSVQESLSACDIIRKRGLTPPPLSMLLKVGHAPSGILKQQKYLKEYLLSSRYICDGLDELVSVFPVSSTSPPRKTVSPPPEIPKGKKHTNYYNQVQCTIYMALISKLVSKFENKGPKSISNLMNGISGGAASPEENDWTSLGKDLLELLMLRSTYLSNKDVSPIWIGNMLIQGILHCDQIRVFQSAVSSIVSARDAPTFLGSIVAELGVTRAHIENLVVRRTASIFDAASSCSDLTLSVAYKYLKLFASDNSEFSLRNSEDFVRLQSFSDLIGIFSLAESHMIPLQLKMADPFSALTHLMRECPAVFVAADSDIENRDGRNANDDRSVTFETFDMAMDIDECLGSEDNLVRSFMLKSRPCPGHKTIQTFLNYYFPDALDQSASRERFEIHAKCEFIYGLNKFSHKRLDLCYRLCFSLIEKNIANVNHLLSDETTRLQDRCRLRDAIAEAHAAVCDSVNQLKTAADPAKAVIIDERPVEELLKNIANSYVLASMADQLHEAICMFEDIAPDVSSQSSHIEFARESIAAILNEILGFGINPEMESIEVVRSAGALNRYMDVIGSIIALPRGDDIDIDAHNFFEHISADLMRKLADASKGGVSKPTKISSNRIVEIDESLVRQLQSMGFSYNGAKRAVMATNSSSKASALRWAVEHSNDADFDEPVVVSMAAKETGSVGSSREPILKHSNYESGPDASKLKRALEYVNDVDELYASMVGRKRPSSEPFQSVSEAASTSFTSGVLGGEQLPVGADTAVLSSSEIPTPPVSGAITLGTQIECNTGDTQGNVEFRIKKQSEEPIPDIDQERLQSPEVISPDPARDLRISSKISSCETDSSRLGPSFPSVDFDMSKDRSIEAEGAESAQLMSPVEIDNSVANQRSPPLHINIVPCDPEAASNLESSVHASSWDDDFEIDSVKDLEERDSHFNETLFVDAAEKQTDTVDENNYQIPENVMLSGAEELEKPPSVSWDDSSHLEGQIISVADNLCEPIANGTNSMNSLEITREALVLTTDPDDEYSSTSAPPAFPVSPSVVASSSPGIRAHLAKTNDAERLQSILETCIFHSLSQLDAERMSHATIFGWNNVADIAGSDLAQLWHDYAVLFRDLALSPQREAFDSIELLWNGLIGALTLAPVVSFALDIISKEIGVFTNSLSLPAPSESDLAVIIRIGSPVDTLASTGLSAVQRTLSKLRVADFVTRSSKRRNHLLPLDDDIEDFQFELFDLDNTAIPVLRADNPAFMQFLASLFVVVDPSSVDGIEFLKKSASDIVNSLVTEPFNEDVKQLKTDLLEEVALIKRLSRIPGVKASSINIKTILVSANLFPISSAKRDVANLKSKRIDAIREILISSSSSGVENVGDAVSNNVAFLHVAPSKQLEVLNVWVRAVGRHLDVSLSELAFHRACQLLCLTKFEESSIEVESDSAALIISGLFKKMKQDHAKDICSIVACCLDDNKVGRSVSGTAPILSWGDTAANSVWKPWWSASRFILLHLYRRISSEGDGLQSISSIAPAKSKQRGSLLQKSNSDNPDSQLDLSAFLKEVLEFVSNGSSLLPADIFASEFGSFFSADQLYRSVRSCYDRDDVTNEALRSIQATFLSRIARIKETDRIDHPIWADALQAYDHFVSSDSSNMSTRLEGILALSFCDTKIFVSNVRNITDLYLSNVWALERVLFVSRPEFHKDLFQFCMDRVEAMSFEGCDSEEIPSGRFQRAHSVVSALKSVMAVSDFDRFGGTIERLLQWTTALTYLGRVVEKIEIIPKSVSVASAMASPESFSKFLAEATTTYLRSSRVDVLNIEYVLRLCINIFRTISGCRVQHYVKNALSDFHIRALDALGLTDQIRSTELRDVYSVSVLDCIVQLLEVCGLCSDICPDLDKFVCEVLIVDLRICEEFPGHFGDFKASFCAAIRNHLLGHSVPIVYENVLRPLSRQLKILLLLLTGGTLSPGDELIAQFFSAYQEPLSIFTKRLMMLAVTSKIDPSIWCKDQRILQSIVCASMDYWNDWLDSISRLGNKRPSQGATSSQLEHVYKVDFAPIFGVSLSDALLLVPMRQTQLDADPEPPFLCSLCCPVVVSILMSSAGYIFEAAQLHFSFSQLPQAVYRADFAIAVWRQFLSRTAVSGIKLLNGRVNADSHVGFDDLPVICRNLLDRLEMQKS